MDKAKKAKAKTRVRNSLGNQPILRSKDLNKINFLDFFLGWKERKKFIQPKNSISNDLIDFQIENYHIVIDKIQKMEQKYKKLMTPEDPLKDIINKTDKEKLFEYIKNLLLLDNSILIYGIGSKLRLIFDFLHYFQNFNTIDYGNQKLNYGDYSYTDEINSYFHILVINGFNPDIKLNMILEQLQNIMLSYCKDNKILKTPIEAGKTIDEQIRLLKILRTHQSLNKKKILLVFNNIDGPSFLGKVVQKYISKLIDIDIQILATCDNVYYYYYWSQYVKDNFSFYFIKYNTFEDYSIEISDKYSITGEKSIKSGLGFSQVYKSLTLLQKKIVKAMAEYQLNNEGGSGLLTHNILCDLLKDQRILTNSTQIKGLLIEPMDHDIIIERQKQGKLVYKLNLNIEILSDLVRGDYDEDN